MSEFMKKAEDFEDKHDPQVDQGVQKVGEQVDQRTGDKYKTEVDKGVGEVQQHD